MPRPVAIVPHTHWDREWYQPFQTFRLRLVDLLDDLIDRLESDDTWTHFLLDGQVAVVDDYLEIRPEAGPRLEKLTRSGRLAVGPWYVLMDEFCVSGETIVRDLQMGLSRAADFGGAMNVGYLPDMFGHVAQMPQLLRLAGFEHAVVWRGVPAAVDRTGFWWQAPDGSTVRAEYLPVGYGNGTALPENPADLLGRIRAHEAEVGDLLLDGMLLMNGSDHELPQPWVPKVVAETNAAQNDYDLAITSLADYLAVAPTDELPGWTGELRSGARANLLMGVASNRVDVKQAAAAAERSLERRAEPLSALLLSADASPARLFELAWREVIRNAAHDSICACSVDPVVDAVLDRYAQATQIARGLTRRALTAFSWTLAEPGITLVNPSARTRSATVKALVLPSGPVPDGAQPLAGGEARHWQRDGRAGDLEALLGDVHTRNREISAGIAAISVTDGGGGIEVMITTDAVDTMDPEVRSTIADLYARAGARPESPIRVRIDERPPQRVAVHVDAVPGFGWSAWTPAPLAPAPVRAAGHSLDNGLVAVEVAGDGTFSLNGLAGMNVLVDDGDAGDTYNYSPPVVDTVVREPSTVRVEVAEAGPVRGRLRVDRTFIWPERVVDDRRIGEQRVEVISLLELRAGERVVRITTSLDNACRDHRLRAWFPLAGRATTSRAECAFAVVERGTEVEGGPHERALPTFPSRRFVQAGGLTIAHDGLLEYELVESGAALALTLLRATGWLSRDGMAYRSRPAGPMIPAEGAQMRGPQTFRYAVCLDPCDPYALVDDVFLPLEVVTAPGGGYRPPSGSALEIEGAEVSAVQRRQGGLEVRVFNPSDRDSVVSLPGRDGDLVDLRGNVVDTFTERVPLRAWGIATLRLS